MTYVMNNCFPSTALVISEEVCERLEAELEPVIELALNEASLDAVDFKCGMVTQCFEDGCNGVKGGAGGVAASVVLWVAALVVMAM